MLKGLSFTYCLLDVLDGTVEASEVECIIAGCTPDQRTIDRATDGAWCYFTSEQIEEALVAVFGTTEVWNSDKLITPVDHLIPNTRNRPRWVESMDEIEWVDRRDVHL
jgi:hypothetical protein